MGRSFLRSIHPVNLLSFGPQTEPILLGPLNILIGPNGSGKSNLIEAVRLLHFLPDKEPWNSVLATGGSGEWIWKGSRNGNRRCSLSAILSLAADPGEFPPDRYRQLRYSVHLDRYESSFRVGEELLETLEAEGARDVLCSWFERSGSVGTIHPRQMLGQPPIDFNLNPDRSILAQLVSRSVQESGIGQWLPELVDVADLFDSFDFHQDWDFGADCPPRDPQYVGQPVDLLEENGSNLAQMLMHYRSDHKPEFEQLTEQARRFYEPVKSIDIRLIGTHLQIVVEESGGFTIPAYRLSDGMLRWLAILAVLLNPTPAPVTFIDEPELGLHPDIIPALADLLREAATRTQLIVTTHSATLVDAFSEYPEAICVAEKVDDSTVIRRLDHKDLAVWLEEYSLGNLWTSGQIGGGRW